MVSARIGVLGWTGLALLDDRRGEPPASLRVKLRSQNRYHNRRPFRTCGKKPCMKDVFGLIR